MNPKVKFALTLVVMFVLILSAIAGGFLVAWPTLSEKTLIAGIYAERVGLFVLFGVFLLGALGALLFYLFKLYVFPPKALAEEIKLILTVNPDYRIVPKGANELKELGIAANRFADSYRTQASDIESRITAAKSDLELEKSRLATLLSELTEGVVVCNTEGRVLLYNSHARQLLEPDDKTKSASGGSLGLGRSLYGVLDKNVISHALDYIRARPDEDHPLSKFVAATPSGEMIKATMAAVSGPQGDITGFVLTMEDLAQAREAASGRDALLRSLTDGMREALGTIRAATETLLDIADMDPKSRGRFIKIIRDKTMESNARLDHTVREFSKYLQAQFLMQEMLGSDLALAIQAKLAATVEVGCTVECPDSAIWLNVESYSLVQAISYIAGKLRDDCGVRKLLLKLEKVGRFAYLDLVWPGTEVSTQQMRSWQLQPLMVKGEGIPMTLKEVAEQQRAEILDHTDKSLNITYLRLILPTAEPAAQPRRGVSRAASLGYYDFDLFHQPGQTTELDESRLSDLAYTVFEARCVSSTAGCCAPRCLIS